MGASQQQSARRHHQLHLDMSPSDLTPESTTTNPQDGKKTVDYRYPTSAAECKLVQHEEYQYLNLIRYILADGESRPDRTGTGTLSIFAPPQLRFSLRDNVFPLLTTKRVFLRAVIEELLWFVKADTNALHLSERGVKIWDGNGSREYLDSIGLKHRKVGDLGPVYGFQWRHFGAEYVDCDSDYTGQGVDQLAEVINKIKNSPYDRRIIMSAWNPKGRTSPYKANGRHDKNGTPTLSSPRSILRPSRRSSPSRTLLSPLPTILRHGSRRPLQHRLLRPLDKNDRSHLRRRRRRINSYHGRCTRL